MAPARRPAGRRRDGKRDPGFCPKQPTAASGVPTAVSLWGASVMWTLSLKIHLVAPNHSEHGKIRETTWKYVGLRGKRENTCKSLQFTNDHERPAIRRESVAFQKRGPEHCGASCGVQGAPGSSSDTYWGLTSEVGKLV